MNIRKLLGFAIGPIGSAALGVLILPLMSWHFDTTDIGRISLMQLTASLMLITLGAGLDQAYIREFHAVNNRASLLKSVLLIPCVLACCATLIWLFILPHYTQWIFELPNNNLGILAWVYCLSLLFTRYLSIILRMQERAWSFSFSQISPKIAILTLLAVCTLLNTTGNTLELMSIFVVAQLCTVVLLFQQTRHTLHAAWHAPSQTSDRVHYLRYGIPLALGGLAYWGLVSIDRLMLKHFSNLNEVGIYAMAANFGALALIVQSIFSTVWSPTLFRWVNENRDLTPVLKIFRLLFGIACAVLCLSCLFAPYIVSLLPVKYREVQFIVVSAMMYPLLYTLAEVSGIGINVSRKTYFNTLISLLAFLLNALLCWLLIQHFQARGAAAATAVSFWVFYALKTECSIKLWYAFPRLQAYGGSLLALVFAVCYTLFGTPDNHIFFAIIAALVCLWLFKQHWQDLQQLFQLFKRKTHTPHLL